MNPKFRSYSTIKDTAQIKPLKIFKKIFAPFGTGISLPHFSILKIRYLLIKQTQFAPIKAPLGVGGARWCGSHAILPLPPHPFPPLFFHPYSSLLYHTPPPIYILGSRHGNRLHGRVSIFSFPYPFLPPPSFPLELLPPLNSPGKCFAFP